MNTPRWHRPAALILAATAALALSACGSPPKAFIVQGHFDVSGSISVDLGYAGSAYQYGDVCVTGIGYDDIHLGAQVVVSDAAGATLAIGGLDAGLADPYEATCAFAFRVPDVPAGLGFYGLSIGSGDRGTMKYAESEISRGEITLTLGL